MTLISIKALTETLTANGFVVRGSERYAEVFTPEHTGPQAVLHNGCVYSSADFILTDRPSGYGYNGFFYGPWHTGMCQADRITKLLAHPAMQ